MSKATLFLLALIITGAGLCFSQEWDVPITVRDGTTGGTSSTELRIGIDLAGTDCYDAGLDQFAPPPPPSGFDARLKICSDDFVTDIRDNNQIQVAIILWYIRCPMTGDETIWNCLVIIRQGT